MKNLTQVNDAPSNRLELTAPEAVASGRFKVIGLYAVIAVTALANAEKGTWLKEQLITYTKNTGVAVFAEGDVVYFDDGNDEMTDQSAGNVKVGIASKVQVQADTTVQMTMLPEAG